MIRLPYTLFEDQSNHFYCFCTV